MLAAGAIYLRPSVNLAAHGSHSAAVSPQPSFPTRLGGVSFGDAEHGAVQVVVLRGSVSLSETYLTADGGRNWTRLRAPSNAFISIQFLGPRRVIERTEGLAGETMLRLSEDAGRTWRALATPTSRAGALYFLDSLNGWWVAGGQFLPTSQPSAVTVWRTRDGGGSWRRLRAAGLPDTGAVSSLTFVDLLRGALLLVSQGAQTSMLATDDGGDTWRPVVAPASLGTGTEVLNNFLIRHGQRLLRLFEAIPEDVVSSSRAGITFDPRSGFDQTSYISISSDGGQTWSQLRAGPRLFTRLGPQSPMLDELGRLLLMQDRELWMSDDDGATWFARVVQVPAGLEPERVVSVAQGALLAIAVEREPAEAPMPTFRQALIRSTDRGVHWSQVRLPILSLA